MIKINFKAIMLSAMLAFGTYAAAQLPTHPDYIKGEGKSETSTNLYKNWQAGQPYSSAAAEDEEFFISRVKPRERFVNAQTQVNPSLNNDRKLLWWVPLGAGSWNAKPSFWFDSEVFSMWSYVDKYANWTATWFRAPAAYLDAAHKNGVRTSVNWNIAWAASVDPNNDNGKLVQALMDGGAEKLLKFCRYYGIEGLGINSEFNFNSSMVEPFRNFYKEVAEKRDAQNWGTYGSVWYNFMTSGGSVATASALNDENKGWFQSGGKEVNKYFFLNYGAGATGMQSSKAKAEELGRSSFDVYAGFNMQSGSQGANWHGIRDYNMSIGMWGAHNMNMLFENRFAEGSKPIAAQRYYKKTSEMFFTGGTRNPVNTPDVMNNSKSSTNYSFLEKFHGISKLVPAFSTLQGDIAKDPFVTYFNLGNGSYFNINGQLANEKEWYNLGVQDYLPTWRWWLTSKFMGREASDVPTEGLKAELTWEDAWFGGSCLEVSGKMDKVEYLHLFKTKYPLQEGDKFTIRYKVVSGHANMNLVCSVEGEETKEVKTKILRTKDSKYDEWITKEVLVGSGIKDINIGGKTLALIAFKFSKATKDFKVRVGELSLTREQAVTPEAPVLKNVKMLRLGSSGVDFKLSYSMNTTKEAPVYNSDVNTWYYKIYYQQEGESEKFATVTTSWAAYMVNGDFNAEGNSKVRVGVSAVSLDGKSESAITWSEYKETPEVSILEGIEKDKAVIKPKEEFTVMFSDIYHKEATKWTIKDQSTGTEVGSFNGGKKFTASIDDIGSYEVTVTYNDGTKDVTLSYPSFIQITPKTVGSMPEIKSFTVNEGEENITVDLKENVNLAYTGRDADGSVSRGLELGEKPFCIKASELDLTDKSTSFSISFWFYYRPGAESVQILNIRNPLENWPANNWGYVWSNIHQNKYYLSVRKQYANSGRPMELAEGMDDYSLSSNTWTHLTYTFAWDNGKLTVKVYVNGKLLGTVPESSDIYHLTKETLFMIGGSAHGRAGIDGMIDEVRFYKKALTAEEVEATMGHIKVADMPDELIGYWDFETDENEQYELISTGKEPIKAATVEFKSGSGEGQAAAVVNVKNVFAQGVPFIEGDVYKVITKPVWSTSRDGIFSDETGNGEAGSAKLYYQKGGQKQITLTLENSWGSVSKTVDYVTVDDATSIDETNIQAAYSAYPNPFHEQVNIKFANEGNYVIKVTNIAGQEVYNKLVSVSAGQFATVSVNNTKGVYLVHIIKDGKTVNVMKVIKK